MIQLEDFLYIMMRKMILFCFLQVSATKTQHESFCLCSYCPAGKAFSVDCLAP